MRVPYIASHISFSRHDRVLLPEPKLYPDIQSARIDVDAACRCLTFVSGPVEEAVFSKWPEDLRTSLTDYRRLQDRAKTPKGGLGAYQPNNKDNLAYGALCCLACSCFHCISRLETKPPPPFQTDTGQS